MRISQTLQNIPLGLTLKVLRFLTLCWEHQRQQQHQLKPPTVAHLVTAELTSFLLMVHTVALQLFVEPTRDNTVSQLNADWKNKISASLHFCLFDQSEPF